jgi:broad specificity phosphatase PhoE
LLFSTDMDSIAEGIELLLIRHAESEWNATARWQGQADVPLSERGRAQASELARSFVAELSKPEETPLYCSDLSRALETARALGAAAGIEPRREPGVRERDVGSWSGRTRREIDTREPALLARFERDDPDARPGGGETRREIRVRAHAVMERIVAEHADCAQIVVVSHLGFLRALLPGVEPTNASVLRVGAADALRRRSLHDQTPGSSLASPL